MRISAVLMAAGALLIVFRGFFLENLRNRPLTALGAATVIAAVVVLIRVGHQYQWTGFGELVRPKLDNQEIQPRKTLWDWLQLFIVPLALAAIGLWFAAQQDQQAQKIENQRAQAEQELAKQRAQDDALQAYLDQMSQLMLGGDLRGSEEGSEVRTLARARTRTVLARLDSRRKGSVVQFLYEASLINMEHPVVDLSGVRLRGADLSGAILSGADLYNADLTKADLSGADLSDADLSETDLIKANLSSSATLSGADLSGADLRNADLRLALLDEADLSRAQLSDADLRDANLRDADLRDANLIKADLSGAILSGADLRDAYLIKADLRDAYLIGARVPDEKLLEEPASLEGATMPDGSIRN